MPDLWQQWKTTIGWVGIHVIYKHVPLSDPVVWSTVGPVLAVNVAPALLCQSKSSPARVLL